MAIIVGSGSIEGGGDLIIRDVNNTLVFEQGIAANGSTFSYSQTPNTPIFIAGFPGADPGWVNGANTNWGKVSSNCTSTTINRGSHYNTTTTRFTAPLSGNYLFIWNAYARATSYFHPAFCINGDLSFANRRGTGWKPRIRGHGMQSNYDQDGQLEEIIQLVAGDYVEVYHYNVALGQLYPLHCQFMGVFLG